MSNFWEWLSHEFHEVLPLAAIWVHEGVRAAGSDLTGAVTAGRPSGATDRHHGLSSGNATVSPKRTVVWGATGAFCR
jgi:hypothetical protein